MIKLPNLVIIVYFCSIKVQKIHRMKVTFKDMALSELYETGKTKDRKYKQVCKNRKLIDGYIRAVKIMCVVESTDELKHLVSFITKS